MLLPIARSQTTAVHHAAEVWTIMELLASVELAKELQGDNIHRMENVLTLAGGIHSGFDSLALWLMPEDEKYSSTSSLPTDASWSLGNQVIKPLLFDSKAF